MCIPVISLFSGCGGLDLGFAREGFGSILAIDSDPSAVASYNHNRPESIARVGDLSCTSGREIAEMITAASPGVQPRGVLGGPPCQSFSSGNAYFKAEDIRHSLPDEYASILKDLNHHYGLDFFVFENVRGITSSKHRDAFAGFKKSFEAAGFTLYEACLDAQYYNVPQRRSRVIIVGFNQEKYAGRSFQFPAPETPSPPTVATAIAGLPDPRFFEKTLKPGDIPYHPNHWAMNPKSSKFRNGLLKSGTNNGKSFRVLSWDRPSYTVAYGHNEVHIHPSGERRLSVYEAMLLQGFPPEYQILGTLTEQMRQVSNAVPPPLAQALAKSVKSFLSGEPGPTVDLPTAPPALQLSLL